MHNLFITTILKNSKMEKTKNCWVIPTDKPSRLWMTKLGNLTRCHNIKPIKEALGNNVNIYITNSEKIKDGDWVYDKILNRVFEFELGEADGDYINENIKKIILTTDPSLAPDVQRIDDDFLEWFCKNISCEKVKVERIGFYKPVKNEETDIPEFDYYEYKIIIPSVEPKQIYYNTVGRENGEFVIKGQFNTQKEALDLANELNKKFPDLYYDWNETLIKEEPKQETLEEEKLIHSLFVSETEEELLREFEGESDKEIKQETLEEAAATYANKELSNELTSKVGNFYGFSESFIEGAKWQQQNSYSEEEVLNFTQTIIMQYKSGNTNIEQLDLLKETLQQFKKK